MTPELISAIASVVTAAASVFGVILAVIGLRTWQREMTGKVNYELARRLLKSVYTVRDAFDHVRQPTEYYAFRATLNCPPDQREERAALAAEQIQENMEALSESMQDLYVEAQEAKVLWGSKLEAPIQSLMNIVLVLESAVARHVTALTAPDSPEAGEHEQIIWVVYAFHGEEDHLKKDMAKVIKDLETQVWPYLGRELGSLSPTSPP
jgi:hypothetical protein